MWFAGSFAPTEVPVVDGMVSMPLKTLVDAVMVKTVPPATFEGLESHADRVDGLMELAGTILLNAMNVVDIPEGQMH
ncbi:hypothetical protein D621_05625 [beta proteobacterium AAP51]|nr:hypothetical protein D621_05625 [beta proteobacterium AAP51]